MTIFKNFSDGLLSVLRVTAAPMLYRYPYRNPGEAFRGDMGRIGEDIDNVMNKLGSHERRTRPRNQ